MCMLVWLLAHVGRGNGTSPMGERHARRLAGT